MSVKNFEVVLCERNDIRDFIEEHHYSKNINGCIADYCFKLLDENGEMIGASFFGRMAMANQWKRYGDSLEQVTELRRLCCIDDTPKNTESFFIGKMLKWLKNNTDIKVVVSYADPEYGHEGTIYKASNFNLDGRSSKGRVIMWNGQKYHDKAIRTKYKGELKPFAKRLKQALEDGEAFYKRTEGKFRYLYYLKDKKKRNNYN